LGGCINEVPHRSYSLYLLLQLVDLQLNYLCLFCEPVRVNLLVFLLLLTGDAPWLLLLLLFLLFPHLLYGLPAFLHFQGGLPAFMLLVLDCVESGLLKR
jgi:hypothetical protein